MFLFCLFVLAANTSSERYQLRVGGLNTTVRPTYVRTYTTIIMNGGSKLPLVQVRESKSLWHQLGDKTNPTPFTAKTILILTNPEHMGPKRAPAATKRDRRRRRIHQ